MLPNSARNTELKNKQLLNLASGLTTAQMTIRQTQQKIID